jgi:hypothetical protein
VNKENIFEELNKMRNLMNAKSGTVISEQVENPIAKTLYYSVAGPGTNPGKFRDAIFQLKNAQEFSSINSELQKFRNSRLDIAGWINDDFDNTNLDDVKKISDHLKSIGVNNSYEIYPGRGGFKQGTFKILTTPPAQAGGRTPEAINNINANFCSVKDGKINTGGSWKGQPWTSYRDTYKVTAEEEAAAQKTCPNVRVGSPSGSGSGSRQSSVNNRFASSAQSLGIQGGKMDLQTLQSILKTLEGGQSTPAASTTSTQGTPDLAQLTAALNQLNA